MSNIFGYLEDQEDNEKVDLIEGNIKESPFNARASI